MFIGHKSESVSLGYTTATFPKVTDTFSYFLQLNINENTPDVQNINMTRAVALLKIIAKDDIPPDVSRLKICLSKYYPSLDVKSISANGSAESIDRSFQYDSSHIGTKGSTYSIYTFTPTNGYTTDIIIQSIDKQGNIMHSIDMEDIPLNLNQQTILSGDIFHAQTSTDITVNTEWGVDIEIPIK